jgi:[acyl-carrier-protein] S-malonyltransferase
MLTAGVAVWRVWQAAGGPAPAVMAGHSLGEYSALVCAGALPFAQAVQLLRQRGEYMKQAVPLGTGEMAAVLGLERAAVEAACAGACSADEIVAVANYNAPLQSVIAGHTAAVARAGSAAQAAGAKRVVTLPVSAPFHCSLMRPAAEALAPAIAAAHISPPAIPVINNVDVAAASDPAAIRDALLRQIYSPVRWVEVIEAMAARGVTHVVECGPGKVLAGLTKRIASELDSLFVQDPASLRQALAALA